MFAEGGLIPKKGDLERVPCPTCKAPVERPVGTESVCGPHGHKVPATMPMLNHEDGCELWIPLPLNATVTFLKPQ